MKQIYVKITEKIACLVDPEQFLVCDNSDYEVVFDFDSDWEGINAKTAIFVYGDTTVYQPFNGNKCEGVPIVDSTLCAIGVFADNIKTSTSANIKCKLSARSFSGAPKPPSEEVYDKIMALFEEAVVDNTAILESFSQILQKLEKRISKLENKHEFASVDGKILKLKNVSVEGTRLILKEATVNGNTIVF